MHYLIEVPEADERHLTNILRDSFPGIEDPVPYALDNGEQANASAMQDTSTYYEEYIRTQNENLLPWEELPEATAMELGAKLTGCIGFMFPGFTLDGELEPEMVAKLMGKDDPQGINPISLPGL